MVVEFADHCGLLEFGDRLAVSRFGSNLGVLSDFPFAVEHSIRTAKLIQHVM